MAKFPLSMTLKHTKPIKKVPKTKGKVPVVVVRSDV